MRPARIVLALVLTGTTLTACTSGGDDASRSSSGASSAGSSTAAATGLSATLRTSLASIESAHFELSGTVAGSALTGSGDQRIENGTLTGLQAQASVPAVGSVGVVIDGSDRYVKLPPPLATAAKPWVKLSTSSSNLVVKQFATLLDTALAAGNLGALADLADAATSTRTVGSEPVDGTPATRYAVTVDPAKLPAELRTALGTAAIPVDLWLDAKQRPLRVRASVPLAGQPVAVTVTFSGYDRPVTITRPPAAQVAAD